MPSVEEVMGDGNDGSLAAAALAAGLDTVSLSQTVVFKRYMRVVLPLDGFVFWIRSEMASPEAIYNDMKFNETLYNAGNRATYFPADTVEVKGSLHYTSALTQEPDESYTSNQVIFTAQSEIADLNEISPTSIYIGTIDKIRFAFGQRTKFFRQAGLWHYVGAAVVPSMHFQVIENPEVLDLRPVVSNSLPIWLRLAVEPPHVWQEPRQVFPLFPSFVVPDNMTTPYGSVHIYPEGTSAMSLPYININSVHNQLAKDRVRITFFGLRSDAVIDFLDAVIDYITNFDDMGLMNIPAIRDEKRSMAELSLLAAKKTIEFEVNYYQTRMNNIARQLIKSAIVANTISDDPPLLENPITAARVKQIT